MDPIVTSRLSLASLALHEPSDDDIKFATEQIAALTSEANALGATPAAAALHFALGRVFIDRLGDRKSAAVCFQNAYELNPRYRPNLEASRRLFAAVGQWDRVVALHEREAEAVKDPIQRAESLRAQAQILASKLGDSEEAARRVSAALALSPDHPALLAQAVEAAERKGDRLEAAKIMSRAAAAQKDDTQRAQYLRRAALALEALQAEALAHADAEAKNEGPVAIEPPRADVKTADPAQVEALLEESLRKLHGADAKDPVGRFALLRRCRAKGIWDEAHRLLRLQAERTQSAADRATAARVLWHRMGHPAEALTEVTAALDEAKRDGALHALSTELTLALGTKETARALNQRAEATLDKSEQADLKVAAAARSGDSLEREQLYSEALAANPGDAAAIALHVRAMSQRDAGDAADRFRALGEALEGHAPDEATSHFLEAAMWLTRAGRDEEAAELGQRVLSLFPDDLAALRLLQRTLPGLGRGEELSALLEDVASRMPPAEAVMLLLRAAAVVADYPAPEGADDSQSGQARALVLTRRAAELAAQLPPVTRGAETWFFLAMRAADRRQLSLVLEARAAGATGSEKADLLVEAAEMARAQKDDARAADLLRRARTHEAELAAAQAAHAPDEPAPGPSAAAAAARRDLLSMPDLPLDERLTLLAEEAEGADSERAAALHAERAALFQLAGRLDEGALACGRALQLGGVDLAVLRRLARIQEARQDYASLLEVRQQIAQAMPEGAGRAEALCRAAEVAEWRCDEPVRAEQCYEAAAREPDAPQASLQALSQLARLRAWAARWPEAAAAYEELAQKAQARERVEALRAAASIRAHRLGEKDLAAAHLRKLLEDEPSDLEAMAELLSLLGLDHSAEGRRERAELRGKIASRCQDPRVSAMLRAETAEDRFAAGERDQGVAEYRRALALNPQDRLSLDLVEEALRASGQRELLASHLAFRCVYADNETKAALALQQAELLAEEGQHDQAAAAYRQAMGSDELALLAIRGARKLAEKSGDKQEQMRLLSKEASVSRSPEQAARCFVSAAQLAEELSDPDEARQYFASALDKDPSHPVAQRHMRDLHRGERLIELVEHYEKIGSAHEVPRLAALAWAQAARLRLYEMKDPQQAYVSAGRGLKLDETCAEALELRGEAAAASGREKEAAEALQKRLALPAEPAQLARVRTLLGKMYAALGEVDKALPLLGGQALDQLELPTLVKAADAIAQAQGAEVAARVYRRLVEEHKAEGDAGDKPVAEAGQLAEWEFRLGEAEASNGHGAQALAAFRGVLARKPGHKEALLRVAELAAAESPAEALAAHRALFEQDVLRVSALHETFALLRKLGKEDEAACVAAALAGLSLANAEEKAVHEAQVAKPLPAELPRLADGAIDRAPLTAPGDEGPARELLHLASWELAKALAPELAGRADRVKGDNPVRRVCNALSRALGGSDPQLFVAKAEPSVVTPLATDPAGLLVGVEVPKRFPARQQRFLYGRALAHIRRGTHMVAGLRPERLGQLVGELVRLTAPPGADMVQLSQLPAGDPELAQKLGSALAPEVELHEDEGARHVDPRERLAPVAAQLLAAFPPDFAALSLAMRETAERAAMVICGDPAAALALVSAEAGGGLEKPEVAQLLRFAVSEQYAAMRAG